jgi:hypothetical protein
MKVVRLTRFNRLKPQKNAKKKPKIVNNDKNRQSATRNKQLSKRWFGKAKELYGIQILRINIRRQPYMVYDAVLLVSPPALTQGYYMEGGAHSGTTYIQPCTACY